MALTNEEIVKLYSSNNPELVQSPEVNATPEQQSQFNQGNEIIQDNSLGNLNSIERTNDWVPNPLHEYETYTYNLKMFIVDQLETRRFLNGEVSIDDMFSGSWPSDDAIVIAQTGLTTEIMIDDLTIRSIGNTQGLDHGGVGTHLSFTLTSVGNAFLIDNILKAIKIMGYPSIAYATFFIDITFTGYGHDGEAYNLPDRRLIPFVISNINDIQTSTTLEGTVATLEGVIATDMGNKPENDIVIEDIEYKIGDTLETTVKNLESAIDQYLAELRFTNDTQYQNSYFFEFSENFKNTYGKNNPIMDSSKPNYQEASNKADPERKGRLPLEMTQNGFIATVHAGTSIKYALRDLVLHSMNVAKSLTETSNTFTKLPHITVHTVPKINGFNMVTGTQAYDIKYFLDIREEFVDQNITDLAEKSTHVTSNIDKLLQQNRLVKKYYSDYTGLNTDILALEVKLNRQLTKTTNNFTSNYSINQHLENYIRGLEGINDQARARLEELSSDHIRLTNEYEQVKRDLERQEKNFDNENREVKNEILSAIRSNLGLGGDGPERAIMAQYNDKSFTELRMAAADDSLVAEALSDSNIASRVEQQDSEWRRLQNIRTAQFEKQNQLKSNDNETFDIVFGVQSTNASNKLYEDVKTIREQSRGNGIMLLENLDDDKVLSLTSKEKQQLLDIILTNPGMFRSSSYKYIENMRRASSVSSNIQIDEDIVNHKFDEGHNIDLSMVNAEMTIVGDPFWISPVTEPKTREIEHVSELQVVNADKERNLQYGIAGTNVVMLIRNAPNGSDENDNLKIDNLFTYLYFVKDIESSFSGGAFTQTLSMIRLDAAKEYEKKFKGEVTVQLDGEP